MLNKIACNCITSATGLLALSLWVSDGAALTISECADRGGFCDASNICVRLGTGDMPTEVLGPCTQVGRPGLDPASDLIVGFIGNTECDKLDRGLDRTKETKDAPWLSVATGQTTITLAGIQKGIKVEEITFKNTNSNAENAGSATVQLLQPTKSTQPLKVTGLKAGMTVGLVQPLVLNDPNPLDPRVVQRLSVAVYDKRTVPVAIHVIAAKSRPGHPPKGCSKPKPKIPKDLMQQLNNIWDQAAIEFELTNTAPKEVDFDLNNDCRLDSGAKRLITEEEQKIIDAVGNTQAKINVYYVQSLTPLETPFGPRKVSAVTFPAKKATFIKDGHNNSTTNITAHELGHSLLLDDVNDNRRLMVEGHPMNNPCFLNKAEWDRANMAAAELLAK